jgi:hypothetical protein
LHELCREDFVESLCIVHKESFCASDAQSLDMLANQSFRSAIVWR